MYFIIFGFGCIFVGIVSSRVFNLPYLAYRKGETDKLSDKELAEVFIQTSSWSAPLATFILMIWVGVVGLLAKDTPNYNPSEILFLLFFAVGFGVFNGIRQYQIYKILISKAK